MTQNRPLKKISLLLAKIEQPKEVETILSILLTPNEQSCLKTRLEILQELIKDHLPQREIAQKLKVSIAKITAGSKEVKKMSSSVKKSLLET